MIMHPNSSMRKSATSYIAVRAQRKQIEGSANRILSPAHNGNRGSNVKPI